MKIMLFGSAGMVGTEFAKQNAVMFSYGNEVDITNHGLVSDLIIGNRPDVVINCAGIASIEECEKNPDLAYAVNVLAVKNMSEVCEKLGIQFVAFSSSEALNPINVYGRGKSEIEKYYGLIIRIPTIISTSKGIFKQLSLGKQIGLFTNMWMNPISVTGLCDIVYQLVDKQIKGVVNIGTSKKINMYELGNVMCDIFKFNKLLISESVYSSDVLKNMDRYLDISQLREFGIIVPTIESDLIKFKKSVENE